VDNTPGDKLGVWRDMRLADALVLTIYTFSTEDVSKCDNVYYFLLLLYLSRKVLCRRIGLQTFNRNSFAKLSQLDVCKLLLVCITPFSFSIIIINN